MSFRVEEIEKNIKNLNTKLCCIQKQLDAGATLEGENAIVYVGPGGELQTSVNNFRYAETGLFIKGLDTQNILTVTNHLNFSLLTLTNAGILTLGITDLDLSTNLSVQNDLLYFDILNNRIGIGTSTPQATLSIRSQGTSNRRGILVEHTDNTTAFSQSKFIGARSRGSHGSPSAVLNNDSLVSFNAVGYKATGWSDTLGGMYVYAGGNFTDVSTPTYITFRGVASGTTVSEWARLNSTGLGIMVTPTATLHVKGNSDSVGSVLKLESLSNNILEAFNTRDILIGGGSLSADTQVEINPYRAAGTTNYVFRVNAQGTDNYMRFVNSNANTVGGLEISRSGYGGRYALTISGGGVTGLIIDSNGQITFGTGYAAAGTISFTNPQVSRNSTDSSIWYTQVGSNGKFVFENISAGSANTSQGMFIVRKNLTQSDVVTFTQHMFEIDGTFNLTNGTKNLIGINYNPTITALSGAHYGLLIRPTGTLNGIGHTTNLPTATWHVKGSSDSTGAMFRAENLSNTSSFNVDNNGVSTFTFPSGGKVLIAGAVGSGETLLEIRRTNVSSGGFIFRSGNSVSQEIATTNGSMYLITSGDNSDIYFNTGTGRVFVSTALANMTAFDTGFQFRVGVQGGSILNRWLNFGHSSTYSQILQAVQNGPTPAVDRISLNPYGGGVTLYGSVSTNHVDVNLADGATSFRVYRVSTTSGISMQQATGGSSVFSISHMDTTNASGNANIAITQGAGAVFAAGSQASATKNNFYGTGYGTINDYALFAGHSYSVSGTERGIVFSSTNINTNANIIQSVHSGAGKPLSLNYYGGNVSIGNILSPTTTLQVKGNSDSVGSSFRVENLSNTSYLDFSNTGVLTTNQPSGGSNWTYASLLRGGSSWMNFGSSSGEEGISKTGNFYLKSTAHIVLQGVNTSISPINFLNASTTGTNGAIGSSGSYYLFSNLGVIVHSAGGSSVESTIVKIGNSISAASGSSNSNINIFESRPTINQTSGTMNIIGYIYNPNITSITGAHYGILVRPDTLNGFGLGATLPTALVDLEGSTTARASLRIRSGSAPTSPNDGDIWNSGTDLFVRLGGTTYTLQKI